MSWTIFILIPLLTNVIEGTVIRGEKANAICQATNSDLEQYLVEVNNPYDCTKYFSCQRIGHTGFLAHLLQCPKGTSFLPRFLKGSCNGPDPKDVLDCFKDLDQGPMWSDWSAWSTCSSSCGDQATKQRSRLCISELLEGQRQQCIGDDHETDTCLDLPSCRGSRKLSSGPGDWSDWSLWSACSASCGDQATKQRSRLCISEPCNGDDIEIGTCLDLPMCSSPWSTWSACSKTCGHASRHRSRQDEMEVDTCPDLPKCQGHWSNWSEWSTCSRTCYDDADDMTPRKIRSRQCLGGEDSVCHGSRLQIRNCENCPHCKLHASRSENLPCTF